jgi:hypothetical protein
MILSVAGIANNNSLQSCFCILDLRAVFLIGGDTKYEDFKRAIIVTHAVLVGVEQVGGGGVTGVADRTIQNDGQQDNTHPVSANEGGKSIWNCNLHHHS